MAKKLIDVSEHQGTIDWNKVKSQIDGAIIRCGYGDDIASQDDKQFLRNVQECERLGIPYGIYLYSYAYNDLMAESEYKHLIRCLKQCKNISLPVYIDLEQKGTEYYGIHCARIVGRKIEAQGYTFGVYSSTSWWKHYLVGLDEFTKWVAQYYIKCEYDKPYDIWQYASDGTINGINGNVDVNWCYKDFSGFKTAKPVLKSIDEVAKEVLDGKWGNGATRKANLTKAGYNYDVVQAKVNQLCSTPKKSNRDVAIEVIAGKWGNGAERKKRLTDAGYNYDAVQSEVNKMF